MATITYSNKVAINTNSNVADINKVNASDMNEIKTVVNTNYNEMTEEINNLTNGEAWQTITLGSGVSVGSLGGTPKCKKIGNVIYLEGGYAYTKSSSQITLGTIPAGYRPENNVYIFTALGGTRVARTLITTDGEIICEWIYNLNNTSAYTGNVSWNTVATSYVVAGV